MDETEQGDRALLNLGHTFGHAFERIDSLRQARSSLVARASLSALVALSSFSAHFRPFPKEDGRKEWSGISPKVGLPTRIRQIDGWSAGADEIIEAMRQDKKVQRGALTFILARDVGSSFIAKNIESESVRAFLEIELRAEA